MGILRRGLIGILAVIICMMILSSNSPALPVNNPENGKDAVNIKILNDALDEVCKINDVCKRVDCYVEIAGKFIDVNSNEQVIGILSLALWEAHKMSPCKEKVRVFSEIAGVFIAIGKTEQAEGILDQAMVLTECLSESKTRIKARVGLLKNYSGLKMSNKVTGIASNVLYEAHHLDNSKFKAQVFTEIAGIFCGMQKDYEARGLLRQAYILAKLSGKKSDVLNAIAVAYADTGDFENAIKVAENIRSEEVKAQTLASISSMMLN